MKIFPSRARLRRTCIAVAALGAVLCFYVWRTWWSPDLTVRTPHYVIRSTASRARTEEAGRALETLHEAYMGLLSGPLEIPGSHPKLEIHLYRDRPEFHRVNPTVGWGEAFYRGGRCHAYYDAARPNPHQWLLHEAVHQIKDEVARLNPPKWIDEGLAEFFSASLYADGKLRLGRPDPDAYPIWWLPEMNLSGDLQADIRSREIIPLRAIIIGRGGPDIDKKFNLYYIHWWSFSHFLMEHDGGRWRGGYFGAIREGGSLQALEKHVGPVEGIQRLWYEHLRELRRETFAGTAGSGPHS